MNQVNTDLDGSSTVELQETKFPMVETESRNKSLSKDGRVKTLRRVIRGKRTNVKEPSKVLLKKITSTNPDTLEDKVLIDRKGRMNIDDDGTIGRKDFTKEQVWQV